jgi:hypothetical protein
MVAVTLVELGRKAEAYELLDDVVRLAEVAAAHDPKYKNAAAAARDKQAPLRSEIGLVTVVGAAALAQPGATLSINGRTIAPERWSTPIAVAPGPVSVALSGEQTRETTVVAGGQVTVDLGQAAAGPSPPPDDIADSDAPFDRMMVVYISGGVGAAGLLSFAIFGGIALGKFNSLDADCPNRQCNIDRQGDADSGATFQAVANVSLGVGIVATCVAGAFLTWELLDDGGDEGDASEASPQATLGFGPGSLMLNGTF